MHMKEKISDNSKKREEEIELRKRQLKLNEKRFEEEKKDREANRAQQAATFELLKAMIDKQK